MTAPSQLGFSQRLRAIRGARSMTMADLAKACDCTPQAVMKWESGQNLPDSRRFVALCEALDCSHEWLFCPDPLDFESTATSPQGRHAKYWVREAIAELREQGFFK